MNWENLLDASAHWGKWLLVAFCLGNTYFNLSQLSTVGAVVVVGSTAVVVADWVNKQRK